MTENQKWFLIISFVVLLFCELATLNNKNNPPKELTPAEQKMNLFKRCAINADEKDLCYRAVYENN